MPAHHLIAGTPHEIMASPWEPGHWMWLSSWGWHDCSIKEDDEIAEGLTFSQKEEILREAIASWHENCHRIFTRRRCARIALDAALYKEGVAASHMEQILDEDPKGSPSERGCALRNMEIFLDLAARMERTCHLHLEANSGVRIAALQGR